MPALWVGSWDWGEGWGQGAKKCRSPSACPRGLWGVGTEGWGPHARVDEITTLGVSCQWSASPWVGHSGLEQKNPGHMEQPKQTD